MSTQDNNPAPTVPGEPHVSSAGGDANVSSPDTLSLADLNAHLGTNYANKDTALKALKETKNFVGKKIDAVNPAPAVAQDQNVVAQIQSLQEQIFYATNPQYKDFADVIKAMGTNPAEVVETEVFKKVLENGKVAGEVAQRKSVVPSNGRLGQEKAVTTEAVRVANATHSTQSTADELVKGIRDAFEI